MDMAMVPTTWKCYTSDAQVDAIAVRPSASSASIGSTRCAEDGSEAASEEDEEEDDHAASTGGDDSTYVALAYSALEGNEWHGGITLVDGATMECVGQFHVPSGVSTLTWCGPNDELLVGGCDTGELHVMQFVSDGDVALVPRPVSSSTDGEAATGLMGHDDIVTGTSALAVTDKTVVASCSWDKSVKLWDLDAMDQPVATFTSHTDLIWCVAGHPKDPHLVLSGAQDSTMMLWDQRHPSYRPVHYTPLSFPVLALDWHPQEEHVVALGLENGSVMTFDMRSGAAPLDHYKELHQGAVHVVRYSPFASDLLASGGDDAHICLTSNTLTKQVTHASHTDYVRALDWMQMPWSPDRSTALLSGSWDKTMKASYLPSSLSHAQTDTS